MVAVGQTFGTSGGVTSQVLVSTDGGATFPTVFNTNLPAGYVSQGDISLAFD